MARYENRYEQICQVLKTGDILLFSADNLIMRFWKKLTDCHWTHVGIAIRSNETEQVLLWESTPLKNIQDVQSEKAVGGVQVVPLMLRASTYAGEASYRQLDFSAADEGITRDNISRKLAEFRKEVRCRPFEADLNRIFKACVDVSNPWRSCAGISRLFCTKLVAAAYKFTDCIDATKPRNGDNGISRLFCSELVAAAFKYAGFIDEDLPAYAYSPKNFAERDNIIGKGIKLGPVRIFKYKPKRRQHLPELLKQLVYQQFRGRSATFGRIVRMMDFRKI